jgi:hypothetical protein
MSKRTFFVILALFALVVSYGLTQGVAAGEGSQPMGRAAGDWPDPGAKHKTGNYSEGSQLGRGESAQHNKMEGIQSGDRDANGLSAVGGPDFYGYTWDDSLPMTWVDGVSGTDTGISYNTVAAGPLNLGFDFNFYENTYNQVYVSRHGFLSFNNFNLYNSQSPIPSPYTPDDVIAPHWTPSDDINYVRYRQGGSEPNRWFLVEWNQQASYDPGYEVDVYTFEVILHENGDFVFNYGDMVESGNLWYYCQSSGIEDDAGTDGLPGSPYCSQIPSANSVNFTRPSGLARVKIDRVDRFKGSFTSAGATSAYSLTINNIGDLAADTFDITSTSPWTVSLFQADGTTPLSDTDTDMVDDTGPVDQGSSAEIVVMVETPGSVNVGDYATTVITATSSLNPAKTASAVLQPAIPARFAQASQDDVISLNSLYLAHPDGSLPISTDDFGEGMAIAEGPTNYVFSWDVYTFTGSVSVTELFYGLVDESGVSIQQLTDHFTATVDTYDYEAAVAVAPDGNIGLIWHRYLEDYGSGDYNENIYFAILDSGGSVTHGPVNVTGFDVWNTYGVGVPRITATGDNRFVLAWGVYYTTNDIYYDDVYYAIYGNDGSVVKSPTNHTNDPGDSVWSWNPALTSLASNRFLLVYQNYTSALGSNLLYTVLDSAGNSVQATASLTNDDRETWDWIPDATELSDGNIFIVWMDDYAENIRYAVLSSLYGLNGPPEVLTSTTYSDGYMSVTADANGNAIVTWQKMESSQRQHLYYSLIDSSGTVITPPMVFLSGHQPDPYIYTNFEGYGNTTYLNEHNFPWLEQNNVYLPLVIR